MLIASSSVQTLNAAKYLKTLCIHFGRKVSVHWQVEYGQVDFQIGLCDIKAQGKQLSFTISSTNQLNLADLVTTIDRHLAKFANKENLHLNWQYTETKSPANTKLVA